ncbi:MAG: hypothetical protein KGH65_01530 [Candidatus Micrarchaeota archaeon]|nr:hypothetical protein [Candidatus Micrarchaeota archaeon]
MAKKSVCVCCGNERNGLEVEVDYVIRAIRFVKEKLHLKVMNNRLIWCKECYPRHMHATKDAAVNPKFEGEGVVILEDAGRHSQNSVERLGYEQSRKAYESRQAVYVGIGIVFALLGIILSPSVTSIAVSIALVVFLYLLSLLNYTPKIAAKQPK